jgi:hypothetical protein
MPLHHVLLRALPYYLYKESYENLVLTSDSLGVFPRYTLEQLSTHAEELVLCLQRSAQGRVTSVHPTIELCARARIHLPAVAVSPR